MGHLNELHEEFADEGLSILAVSDEPTSRIEAFIEQHGAKYPIITDGNGCISAYQVSAVPSSFLIGPEGTILWSGHPSGFTSEVVKEHIGDVQLLPDFPKSLAAVERSMKKGKYGDALKKVEALITKGKLPDEDKDVAERVRAHIDGVASRGLKRAAKNLRDRKVSEAYAAYEKLEEKFKGHDYSKKAKAAAKALMANKDNKAEIKAAEKWAKIKPQLEGMSAKKAIPLLKTLTGKKYGETKAGKAAARKLKQLEHAIK